MKKIIKKSYLLIGLLIFIWVIKDINFNEFKRVIININLIYYIGALFMYLPIAISKSFKWKKIMETQDIYYSTKEAFLMSGSSSLLGLITPGKLGEYSKIAYLKKDNYSLTRAFLGSFLDKIFDLLFVFIFTIISLIFIRLPFKLYFDYFSLIKWVVLGGIILIALIFFFYFKNRDGLKKIFIEVVKDLRKFNIKKIIIILFFTSITWFFYFLMIYLIALSINLNQLIGFFYIAFAAVFGILSAFIPISILGIGTREASLLFLLIPAGVSKETIIFFSLLITVNYISLFVIYLYCWFKKPII